MITITTKEKWQEFEFSSQPIKGELNKVWVGFTSSNKNKIDLFIRFGKIDSREVVLEPAVEAVEEVLNEAKEVVTVKVEAKEAIMETQYYFDFYTNAFSTESEKINEEVVGYNLKTAHEEAKSWLEKSSKTKASYEIEL